jgi:hypothetical protein
MQSADFVDYLNVTTESNMNLWVFNNGDYPRLSQTVNTATMASHFESGAGTEANPYMIMTAKQLRIFSVLSQSRNFNQEFVKLGNNIDLEGEATNRDNDWLAIGTRADEFFNGTFDGGGFEISRLFINSSLANQGLFRRIASGAIVRNVGVVNSSVTGTGYLGGLAGTNQGRILNSYYIGSVAGTGSWVGGLVGYNNGTIWSNPARIINSYAAANVTGGATYVGGLVGHVGSSTITGSYYLSSAPNNDLGTPKTQAELQASSFINFLNLGASNQSVSVMNGWVARAEGYPRLTTAAVGETNLAPFFDGGTGTQASPFMINSLATLQTFSTLSDIGTNFAGVFLRLSADIQLNDPAGTGNWDSFEWWRHDAPPANVWTPNATAFRGTFDGGGRTLRGFYTTRGGIFGEIDTDGVVKNLRIVESFISGGQNQNIGGVAENNYGTIDNCHFEGVIHSFGTGSMVGGLVGRNYTNANIINSHANATISRATAAGSTTYGGLTGQNNGTISNSYALGSISVNPATAGNIGGLVGWVAGGNINNSFAAVSTDVGNNANHGGLVGHVGGANSINNSFYDAQVSGQSDS